MSTSRTAAALTALTLALAGCASPEPAPPEATSGASSTDGRTATAEQSPTGEETAFVPGPQGEPAPEPAHEPISLSPDRPTTLAYAFEGTTGTVTVPTAPPEQMELYRRGVGLVEPVVYAEVTIDNREGAEPFPVQGLKLYTPEGEQVMFVSLPVAVSEWGLEAEVPLATSELGSQITAEHENAGMPGELTTVPLVLTGELPAEVASVALELPGFDEIPAVPAG